MQDAIEELKAKQEKELQNAIKAESIKARVKSALNLTDDNFAVGYMHVHKADCWIKMDADDLPSALHKCEIMNPLQAVRLKGTFLSFRADRTLTEKEKEENDQTMIPYFYVIDGLRQYGDEKTLTWFVDADGLTVEVRCKVKSDPLTRRDFHISFDRYGNAHKDKNELINKSGEFIRVDRFWSSDDQPSRFVLSA
jgi:hypothetical protein